MGAGWDAFWESFWPTLGASAASMWQALLDNPWMLVVFGGLAVFAVVTRVTSNRRGR